MDARFIQKLSVRYKGVLVVLALLALASYLVLAQVMHSNAGWAERINVSGRQRMISQQIALLAARMMHATGFSERQEIGRTLQHAIDKMEADHLWLEEDARLHLPSHLEIHYSGHMDTADQQLHTFLEHARMVVNWREGEEMSTHASLRIVTESAMGVLLSALDRVVSDYQQESERQIDRLKQIQLAILAQTWLILLLSALWVFAPLVKQMRREEERREKAEESLRKLSLAVEQAPVSVMILDTRGVVEYVNPHYGQVSGFPDQEVIGQELRNVQMRSSRNSGTCDHSWEGIMGEERWQGILCQCRKNGELYWEENVIAPLRNEMGQITHYIAIKEDVSQRKRQEEELLQAKHEAITANRAKSEFLSSMSHELRTPMNAILGFAQLLASDPMEPLSADQLDSVNHIIKGGEYLLTLINDVLDLAKIEAGRVTLSIENVALRSIIEETLPMAHALADRYEIMLVDHTETVVRPIMRCDFTRMKQILLNLLSNAIKYNRSGGQVTLECRDVSGGMMRLSVIDTGWGIPEEKQKELFKPFNRLDAENSEIEGTGIGLTISKQLVEKMGGRIGFESVVGQGSTFWIDLPLAPRGEGGKEISMPENLVCEEEFTTKKRSILYVEDNPANMRLMEGIIRRVPNYTLLTAHNGALGLMLAESRLPDLIILDINLPGMNGFEILEQLRGMPLTAAIPVIALSANALPREVDKGMAAGFFRYLTKPIKIDALLAAIHEASG